MIKANLDVAYRVISGRINPGIVKIETKFKNDFSILLLANSITLTPGTLSVDVTDDNSIYVHILNMKSDWVKNKTNTVNAQEVCGSMINWVRRISE